jgi:Mn-containing catalase
LVEDLAAEQKARATYEHLIQLADDPDVIEPLKFLREREVCALSEVWRNIDEGSRLHGFLKKMY